MKKSYVHILILTLVLGTGIGIQLKNNYNAVRELSFFDKQIIDQVNRAKQENKKLITKKEYLNNQLEILEENKIDDPLGKSMKENIDNLKMILGYKDLQGPGMVIKIDTEEDVNLGELMERNSFFVRLINQIKVYGGEAISINGQRVSKYGAVALAGSHINVNFTPIVQPYEIKIIGDSDTLEKHINNKNGIIQYMQSYGLDIDIKIYDTLTIKGMPREKEFRFTNTN
ncbi:MAG: DUF881 domain-containing protein [Tepidibacter sp.]|jgi:uncharacterized protein YlxW (UPF0749 family)|uniref:DUF881 domain-containing protein n=1 Tax=Tepidibacter sp. TaxID=2529387 RepID=UPI0025E8C0C9|nr:DUF881 domain-containing protein [Tepidibacter sp.]MCT4509426.1 DUF881 domain-containing protein [Tepidibacter sp.]